MAKGTKKKTVAAKKKVVATSRPADKKGIFTLQVFLIEGPVSKGYCTKNKMVFRTIQLRGDNTLEDLHKAIFTAYGREEDRRYEFQIGGVGPDDATAQYYVLTAERADWDSLTNFPRAAGVVEGTEIGSVGLKKGMSFGYWFGMEWLHQIDVLEVGGKPEPGVYPRVTECFGESPPQYPPEAAKSPRKKSAAKRGIKKPAAKKPKVAKKAVKKAPKKKAAKKVVKRAAKKPKVAKKAVKK